MREVSSDKEKITKIRFQYPTREFTIEKTDDKWSGTLPYSFDVDEDKVDDILVIMSDLTAVKIPEQTFQGTGLDKHNIIIQAIGEDMEAVLMVGDDNGEELFYAKRGDSDNIYLITEKQRDKLNIKISDLK